MQDDMSRRHFIKTSAAGAAGAAVALRAADALAAPEKSRIVVARGDAVPDTDAIALKRMQAALDKWGGFADMVKGKRVMIKINATDGGYRDANTSSQATTALLKLVNDCAPKSVTVLGQEWNGWRAKRKGLPTLGEVVKNAKATQYNLPRYWTAGSEKAYKLIDPQPEPWKELMVAKELFEDDTVCLNLARLKTHPHCVYTGIIKNIIGLTRRMYGFHKVDERTEVAKRFDPADSDGWHIFPKKLANAWKMAVGPNLDLNILDAGEPCFGWRGPGSQRIGAFPAGVTVVGKDGLAMDVFGCKLLGEGLNKKTPGLYPEPLGDWGTGDSDYIKFNKTKTNYLKTCAELGVGEADLSKVDIQEVQG
jgi:uncharacterized protein (DUF362 family)